MNDDDQVFEKLTDDIKKMFAGDVVKFDAKEIEIIWFDGGMEPVAQQKVMVPVNHVKGVANYCEAVRVPEGAVYMIPFGVFADKIEIIKEKQDDNKSNKKAY